MLTLSGDFTIEPSLNRTQKDLQNKLLHNISTANDCVECRIILSKNALALIGRGAGRELERDDGEVGCGGAHNHSIQWEEISVLDHGRGMGAVGEGGLAHPDDTFKRAL